MKKRTTLLVAVFMVIGLFSWSATTAKKEVKKGPTKVVWNLEYEPKSADPQIGTDTSFIQMAAACFEGLTRIGKNNEIIPGMAEKWTVKDNVYTFNLRKNVKWSNGEPVTADDFYFGIKRAIDPATAAEYAYMTYYIKNAQAFNEKKITDFSQVGLKVVDKYTLQMELEKPAAFFPSVVAFITYMPVNEKFYNTVKEKFGTDANALMYNGPWVIKEWIHENKVVMEKNPNYWNAKNIKIDTLEFLMIKDLTTASNMYKSGELDVANISGVNIPEYQGSKELKQYADGSIFYFEFNTTNKILANKNIRKAITYAIDRKTFVNNVLRDNSKAALAMVPPSFPGIKGDFRKENGDALFKDNNVAEAKKLFDKGLKELGIKGPVSFKLTCDNRDTTQKYMQFVQAQLNQKLGINIELEPVTFQIRLQKMTSKDFEIVFAGWGPDYNDPMTFMDLWITDGGNNHTSWSNTVYDKYIETAQKSTDDKVRMTSMAKAEKLLMDEMPLGPLFFRNRNYVAKPYVKGIVRRAAGADIDFYWASIEK